MKIAFLHFHLKTGGVTTVIKHQIKALRSLPGRDSGKARGEAFEILAIAGVSSEQDFPAEAVIIPGLAYDSEGGSAHDPVETASAVWDAIHTKWPDGCDVLHVHNPTLAKNRNFLKILRALQEKGAKLFLQIHDFAEDGRPGAYFFEPYPADCHYGVINSRDHRILLRAGLHTRGLHLLPNTVQPLSFDGHLRSDDSRHVLYPVRAIRRKNIGEAILTSQLFDDPAPLCITLPPNSPADFPSYGSWKEFVAQENLKVVFEAGLKEKFAHLVLSSRFLITTSITEGFGFSFLEPWTAGKYLWGRKLPDICVDFEQNGIRLDHLYSRLNAPLDWLDEAAFRKEWESCFKGACRHFGFSADAELAGTGYARITKSGSIDLALLSEPFQQQILSVVLASVDAKRKLLRINPRLRLPEREPENQSLIAHNREAVRRHYNLTSYRKNILAIYGRVSSTRVSHSIDKTSLLGIFIRPENFSLLKWSTYVE